MMFEPSDSLIEDETNHILLCYCTFVMMMKGKKLSTQNVFVTTLQEPKFKNILINLLSLESDYEVVKLFLDFDPSIAKSKYVTKWTRSKSNSKNK